MRICILAVIISKTMVYRISELMLDAPGLILPSIHQREGRPALNVTVFEKLKEKAMHHQRRNRF